MMLRDLLLHLKSLIWCLNKDRKRYNLRLILDSLNARHVPESIQSAPLGQNLNYLIQNLAPQGSLQTLVHSLHRIRKSDVKSEGALGDLELGHYLKTKRAVEEIPPGSYGVVSFLGNVIDGLNVINGLFYVEGRGLMEKTISPEQVDVIFGTTI